jgi:hypothetical protein
MCGFDHGVPYNAANWLLHIDPDHSAGLDVHCPAAKLYLLRASKNIQSMPLFQGD